MEDVTGSKQAYKTAVSEVVGLLGRSTNNASSSKDAFLEELCALRADVSAKYDKSTSVLNSLIQTITEEARANIDLVSKVNVRSETLRSLFSDIERLCEESSQLVNREHVTKLSRASYNISKTVQNTEDIIAIPSLALEAQQLIQEGQESEDAAGVDLVQSYVGIAQLEGASLFARQAVVRQGRAPSEGAASAASDLSSGEGDPRDESVYQDTTLSEYFDKVLVTSAKFETFLWSTMRNFIALGRTHPEQLLSAVKVVEIQEHRDLTDAEDGSGELKQKKRWKARLFEEIEQAIENSTAPLSKLCQMIGESVDTSRQTQTISIDEVLEVANSVAAYFTDIYDYSAPCFPKSYDIFSFMMKAYHRGFGKMIDSLGDFSEYLSNRQILSIITWITQYHNFIESLGIDRTAETKEWDYCDLIDIRKEQKAKAGGRRKSILSLDAFLRPEGAPEEGKEAEPSNAPEKPGVMGFNSLTQTFMTRMREYLTNWFGNIIEAEDKMMAKPKEDDNGKLWTPALIDLFRILNQQVSIVQKATTGPMLLETARTIIQVMIEFQGIERDRLGAPVDAEAALEAAVAAVNTNLKAYDMSLELAETIETALDESCRGAVDIEEACRGFLQVSKLAVDQVVKCIIEDEGIVQMFARSMFSPDWLTGGATSVLLATLEDYMQDVTRWIEKSFLKRVVESLITNVVDKWISAFISKTPIIQKEVTDQIVRDCSQLRDFFAKYSRDSDHKAFQLMESFSDIVDADDADSFVISYRLLLDVRSDFAPSNLERVLSAREDISKREAANVLSQCEEIFASRKNLLANHSIKAVTSAYRFFKNTKNSAGAKQS